MRVIGTAPTTGSRSSASEALANIAARQQGLVTSQQLGEVGLSHAAIHRRVVARQLAPVHRGVYALGHATMHDQQRWMAAVLAAGDGAVLARTSAARLWGVWRGRERGTHVVTRAQRRSRPGVSVHSSRALSERDVTVHRGVPVTTVERTIIDLGDVLTQYQLANVMYEAAFRQLLDVGRLRLAILQVTGRRASTIATAALDAYLQGSAGTRSALEDRFISLLHHHRIEMPAVNRRISVGGQSLEPDFLWAAQRLCVELDGPGHERPPAKRNDAVHSAQMEAIGIEVMRVTEVDLDYEPAEVMARVRRALEGRTLASAGPGTSARS